MDAMKAQEAKMSNILNLQSIWFALNFFASGLCTNWNSWQAGMCCAPWSASRSRFGALALACWRCIHPWWRGGGAGCRDAMQRSDGCAQHVRRMHLGFVDQLMAEVINLANMIEGNNKCLRLKILNTFGGYSRIKSLDTKKQTWNENFRESLNRAQIIWVWVR